MIEYSCLSTVASFKITQTVKTAAAAAKSPQSCPTLCDPTDGSPPGSPVPGILQARTPEWVAISFSNAWKWKWSCSVMSDSSRPHGLQPTRLLHPWAFPGKSTGVGCHCLLQVKTEMDPKPMLLLTNAYNGCSDNRCPRDAQRSHSITLMDCLPKSLACIQFWGNKSDQSKLRAIP